MQGIDPAAVTSLSALVRGFYKELRKQLDTQQGAVPEVVWRIHDDGEASPPPVQWPEPDLLPEPPRRLASGFPPSEDAASYPQPPSSHASIAGPSDLLGSHCSKRLCVRPPITSRSLPLRLFPPLTRAEWRGLPDLPFLAVAVSGSSPIAGARHRS